MADFAIELEEGTASEIATLLAELEIAGPRRTTQPVPQQVVSHCVEAKARLLFYFQGKPVLEAYLCEFVKPLDDLETAFFQLLEERGIETGVGAQLDGIGQIVGQARDGRTDDEYRVALRVRLLVLLSDGKREQLLTILREMTADAFTIGAKAYFPASVVYSLLENATGQDIEEIVANLSAAKGGGVRLFFVYSLQTPANTFTFSSVYNTSETDTGQGFSNTGQTTGGYLTAVEIAS